MSEDESKMSDKDKDLYEFIKQRDSTEEDLKIFSDPLFCLKYKDTKLYVRRDDSYEKPMTLVVGFLDEIVYETTNMEVVAMLVNKHIEIKHDEQAVQAYKDAQFHELITKELK